MDNYYYKIALKEYMSGIEVDKEIKELQESTEEDYLIEMNVFAKESYQSRKFTVVIIFSVMVLESFVYQYGKRHLGSSYYKDHLDRLDLASKWLVTPQLATGSSIQKSGQAYEGLKKLIKERNHLVHHKGGNDATYSHEYYNQVKDGAKNAILTIELLLKELDRLHQGKTNYVESILCTDECFA